MECYFHNASAVDAFHLQKNQWEVRAELTCVVTAVTFSEGQHGQDGVNQSLRKDVGKKIGFEMHGLNSLDNFLFLLGDWKMICSYIKYTFIDFVISC